MRTFTCALVVACLMAVASAEMYLISDNQSFRMVANDTGMTTTVNADPAVVGTAAAPFGGVYGLSLDEKNQVFYGTYPSTHSVVQIDPKVSPWTVKVIAGTGAAGTVDGAAAAAQFNQPISTAVMADGSVLVSTVTGNLVRKISPDLQTVSPYLGGGAAPADGVGTNAVLATPGQIVMDGSGNTYVMSNLVVRAVAPDLTVSTLAGNTAGVVDAVGTNANFQNAFFGGVSPDGKTLYTTSASGAAVTQVPFFGGLAASASAIRAIDVAGKSVSTVAGLTSATGVALDGTGTSAVITAVSAMTVDGSGNVIFAEGCSAGSVIRRFVPGVNGADGTTTTVAGTLTGATCTQGAAPIVGLASADGAAASAKFRAPTSILAIQKICGKFYAAGSSPTITGTCSDIGSGTVPSLSAASAVKVTSPLTVAGVLAVLAGGSLTADAPVTVNDALTVSGNGSVVCNGNDIMANSLTLSDMSVYQILVSKDSPGRFKITNAAALAGSLVLSVQKGFAFGVGKSVPVVDFGSFSGAFKETFLVFLFSRSASSSRNLLQANAAATTCTGNQCVSTGVATGADDDDEIPFIVALIVVAALLFIGIAAAVYFASTGGLPSFGKDDTTPAAAPYGGETAAAFDDFASYSSSSSSSSEGLFFQPGYSYSY